MALDEPKDADEKFEIDGFTYLVDKQLFAEVQPVTIDFKSVGFHITGHLPGRSGQCSC